MIVQPLRALRLLTAALGAAGILLAAPAIAQAGYGFTSILDIPATPAQKVVTVGQTNVPSGITLHPNLTGGETGATMRMESLVIAPSCVFNSTNSPFNHGCDTTAEPGVFRTSATGTGSQNCTGISFAISAPNARGESAVTPSAPVALMNGQACVISFLSDVLKVPTTDVSSLPGAQTNETSAVFASVLADPGNPAGTGLCCVGATSVAQVTVLPAATNPPTPPSAVLDTPGGCPKRSASISVTGSQIDKVTFFVNGKKVATDDRAPFATKVKIGKLSFGSHPVKAVVDFTAASGKAGDTFTGRIVRCRPPKPKFTG
jgi:hypothetical protein